jgi:hypothetical protein
VTAKRTAKRHPGKAAARKGSAPPAVGTPLAQFTALSSFLTGFDEAELHGTGMMQVYFDLIPSIVGADVLGRLLTRWTNLYARGAGDERLLEELVTTGLFDDPDLGPIARNLAGLWYLGMWNQLPSAWRGVHGAFAADTTFIVSPQSYAAGLVWPALHTHPPAAKQPGYGSWALPPDGAPE